MKPTLLVVDDDDELCTQLHWALCTEYDVLRAADRNGAVTLFRQHRPAVVMLDLGLPPHAGTPEEGMATLEEILELENRTKVVIVSGQSDRTNAMHAVGAGAYDFVAKPLDPEQLRLMLHRCFHVATLEREYLELKRAAAPEPFEGMLGSSSSMRSVITSIRKVAGSDVPVLILGESGTGKEMTARAIHQASLRRQGSFVAINCSAIPETLLESELFGHEKGAFTGAYIQRKGRIEQAAGGTLFLDEIGDIPLAVQVKLLRFLQERSVVRVGGGKEISVDARVIAATNADLDKAVGAGTFREDLFYRLAVVKLHLPPLREREEDLRLMAQTFLHRSAAENGRRQLRFSTDALEAMRRHSWPGNVRELQNRIRRAVVMSDGPRLTADDLELSTPQVIPQTASTLKEARETLERDLVGRALRKHYWKITAAADELGVSRPTLYELIDRLGLTRPNGDSDSRDARPVLSVATPPPLTTRVARSL